MSRLVTASSGAAVAWTRVYTRGLPDALRARREAEIRSDLFEHVHAASHADTDPTRVGLEVLVRVLTGLPADLAWRWGSLNGRHVGVPISRRLMTMIARIFTAAGAAATVLLGTFIATNGLGIAIEGGDGGERYVLLGAVEILVGVLLIGGVVVAPRVPKWSVAMIAVAVVGAAAIHYWMWIVFAAIGAVLLAAAAVRTKRIVQRRSGALA